MSNDKSTMSTFADFCMNEVRGNRHTPNLAKTFNGFLEYWKDRMQENHGDFEKDRKYELANTVLRDSANYVLFHDCERCGLLDITVIDVSKSFDLEMNMVFSSRPLLFTMMEWKDL